VAASTRLAAIILTDDGCVTYANGAAARILGRAADEPQSFSIDDIPDWDTREIKATALRAIAEQKGLTLDTQLKYLPGDELWISSRFEPFAADGAVRVMMIFIDVSERRRAERRSEAMLELLHLCNRARDVSELIRGLIPFFEKVTGYESVGFLLQAESGGVPCQEGEDRSFAVVPLMSGGEQHGVMHCHDRRAGRHRPGETAFIEELAGVAAGALARFDSERARRASEEHLNQILETAEAGYFLIDSEGFYRRVNRGWLQIHGYEREEEVVGQHFGVTEPDREHAQGPPIYARALAGEAVPPGSSMHRRRDGTTGEHSFSLRVLRKGGRTEGLEGFLIDTTDLRQLEQRYQMLFARMLDGFALADVILDSRGKVADLRFLAVNPALERMTGLSAAALVGRLASEAAPRIRTAWIETCAEVIRTGEPRRVEYRAKAHKKAFEVLAFAPEPGRFACLVQDVTERKLLEAQFHQAQKMEAIGQLAGSVAHDFNNILSSTMMHLGLLQMDPGIAPEMRVALKELTVEARRAAALTRQLLTFSRRQHLKVKPVDLDALLSNLLHMLERLIGENIRLVYSDGAPLWIEADSGMIEQLVMNLCVNARDAMPRGGTLTISARPVTITAHQRKANPGSRASSCVVLTVADTGCGMDEATLSRIFEPFFTTKAAGKGTGLGLATVYGIAKQHGGWVEVQSALGQGSSFDVYLPTAVAPAEPETPAVAEAVRGGCETILLVEDDSVVRQTAHACLRKYGYRVIEADSGKSALGLWETHAAEIDLLLTDMVMPGGLSGLELVKQLRLQKPGLKVILASGYHSQIDHGFSSVGHGVKYLAKPFEATALAASVRSCLDGGP